MISNVMSAIRSLTVKRAINEDLFEAVVISLMPKKRWSHLLQREQISPVFSTYVPVWMKAINI